LSGIIEDEDNKMKKIIKNFRVKNLTFELLILCLLLIFPIKVYANETKYSPGAKIYEDNNNSYPEETAVQNFSYGKTAIGEFYFEGSVTKESTYKGYNAYAVEDTFSLAYGYDNSYQTKEKDNWNLVSDSSKSVAGIQLPKKMGKGAIIIQKSIDGSTWENAVDPIINFFENTKVDRSALYSVTDEDLKNGTYFRVLVSLLTSQSFNSLE
jgi:hypothetical protein